MLNKSIYTHPSNIGALGAMEIGEASPFPCDLLYGLPIYVDKNLPATRPTGKVKFPNWDFCEFEEKDEGWALGLGFATREEEPVYYIMDTSKFKVDWDIPNLKLDWSINEETKKTYKKYTQEIQERVIQKVLDRINNEIINPIIR